MWKESLCIGVDNIDAQHKELFTKVDQLISEVHSDGEDRKNKCISTILFLKRYAVKHFEDEEAYQQSIGYKYFDRHKKLHEKFLVTVLDHEKKMTASDFAENDVKAFTGTLLAWLYYHVADADQKIGKEDVITEHLHAHNDIIYYSICDVLSKMADFDIKTMKWIDKYNETPEDAVIVKVPFDGDQTGYFAYVYPKTLISEIMKAMMGFVPEDIDELEISAMYEMANITSGSICRLISESDDIFYNIATPEIAERTDMQTAEKVAVDTGRGVVEAFISIA